MDCFKIATISEKFKSLLFCFGSAGIQIGGLRVVHKDWVYYTSLPNDASPEVVSLNISKCLLYFPRAGHTMHSQWSCCVDVSIGGGGKLLQNQLHDERKNLVSSKNNMSQCQSYESADRSL